MIEYYQDPEAGRLSIALWDLARPGRTEAEREDRMFNVVEAADESTWLEVDTEFAFVVHPDAVLGDLAEIMQPRLSVESIAALGARILNLRGQLVVASTEFAEVFNGQPQAQPEGGM